MECKDIVAGEPDHTGLGWRSRRLRSAFSADLDPVAGMNGAQPSAARSSWSSRVGWVTSCALRWPA